MRFIPIYVGDDVTDEDAFRALEGEGFGILVAQAERPTGATYRLDDPEAVERFLNRVGNTLKRSRLGEAGNLCVRRSSQKGRLYARRSWPVSATPSRTSACRAASVTTCSVLHAARR